MYKFIAGCYQIHIFLLLRSRLNIMSLCECVPGGGGHCIVGFYKKVKQSTCRSLNRICKYRITFLSTKQVHVIFATLFFSNFTSRQSDFYSLDNMTKLRVNLKHPRFLWACVFTFKSTLILRSIEHIDQPKQKHLRLVLVNKN